MTCTAEMKPIFELSGESGCPARERMSRTERSPRPDVASFSSRLSTALSKKKQARKELPVSNDRPRHNDASSSAAGGAPRVPGPTAGANFGRKRSWTLDASAEVYHRRSHKLPGSCFQLRREARLDAAGVISRRMHFDADVMTMDARSK